MTPDYTPPSQDPLDAELSRRDQADKQALPSNDPLDIEIKKREFDEYQNRDVDMSQEKAYFDKNLATNTNAKEAKTFLEALEAGWDVSVSGLRINQKNPELVVPKDAPMFYKIASGAATLVGDVPAMVAGGVAGGVAGTLAAPGVGTAIGIGAGSFALPSGIRTLLMERYKKGDIKDFKDFYERSSSVLLESLKGGVIGGATAGVGGAVAKIAAPIAAPVVTSVAKTAAEIGTMTTVGAALDGHAPTFDDFAEATILVGGLHMVGPIAAPISKNISNKLMDIYAKTGVKPSEVAIASETDGVLKQELMSTSQKIPSKYEALTPQDKPAELSNPEAINVDLTANEKIASQIETPAEAAKVPVSEKIEKVKADLSKTYTALIDKFNPVENFVNQVKESTKTEIPASKDPYVLLRLTAGDFGRLEATVFSGPRDFKDPTKVVGKSLKEIVSPFKTEQEISELQNYVVSKRALEKGVQGFETGFDSEAAKEVVKTGSAKYEKASKEITEFLNHNLKYLKDSGVISEELLNKSKEFNKDFVPWARVGKPEKGVGPDLTVKNPVKKFTGSDKKIKNVYETILQDTYIKLKVAERNRAMTALADLDLKLPESDRIFERVKTETKTIDVSPEEVANYLFPGEKDMQAVLSQELNDPMTIFRPKSKSLGADEIAIYRDGKREVLKVKDQEILKTLKAMDKETANSFMQVAEGISKAKRAGIIFTPAYGLKNTIRDQFTAYSFSKYDYLPFKDMVAGLGEVIGKGPEYYDWLAHGGAQSVSTAIDTNYFKKNIFELHKETGFLNGVKNVVRNPIESMRAMNEASEVGTRVGLYGKAFEKTNDAFLSAFESREGTVDFARKGRNPTVQQLNKLTDFQNVGVQAIDRFYRAAKEDPKGVLKRAAYMITAPSILIWMYNQRHKEIYDSIPNYVKDTHWVFINSDDPKAPIIRIPKPQELGILFGTLPERTLEAFFNDNPRAYKNFQESLSGLNPYNMPDIAQPLVEHWGNKSLFTGNSLIPSALEKVAPQEQYREYTSDTAKALGKIIGYMPGDHPRAGFSSPAIIDNYIQSWTGTLGTYATKIIDQGLKAAHIAEPSQKPASTLADIPFIQSFIVRYPSASLQTIQDFNDRTDAAFQSKNTIEINKKRFDFNEMQNNSVLAQHSGDIVQLKGMKATVDLLTHNIQKISILPGLDRDEKRQLIDSLYLQMNEISKLGLGIYDTIEAELKKSEGK